MKTLRKTGDGETLAAVVGDGDEKEKDIEGMEVSQMTKDIMDCIRERRSIRKFKTEPIPDASIGRLVEAALLAPSAGNMQPWAFYVVKNQATKEALVGAALGQSFLAQAPVVIVVCAAPERSASRYRERGAELYCLQDTAAAVENILLAAVGFGLGTCWIGAFNEQEVARILDLPPHLRPVAMIPVGYPDQERGPRSFRPKEEVLVVVD